MFLKNFKDLLLNHLRCWYTEQLRVNEIHIVKPEILNFLYWTYVPFSGIPPYYTKHTRRNCWICMLYSLIMGPDGQTIVSGRNTNSCKRDILYIYIVISSLSQLCNPLTLTAFFHKFRYHICMHSSYNQPLQLSFYETVRFSEHRQTKFDTHATAYTFSQESGVKKDLTSYV